MHELWSYISQNGDELPKHLNLGEADPDGIHKKKISKLETKGSGLIQDRWASDLNEKLSKTGARVHALRVVLKAKEKRMYGDAMSIVLRLLKIAHTRELANLYYLFSKRKTIGILSSMMKYFHKKRGLESLMKLSQTHERYKMTKALTRLSGFTGVNHKGNSRLLVLTLEDLLKTKSASGAFERLKYYSKYQWLQTVNSGELIVNVLRVWRSYSRQRKGIKSLFVYPFQRQFFQTLRLQSLARRLDRGQDRLNSVLKVIYSRRLLRGMSILEQTNRSSSQSPASADHSAERAVVFQNRQLTTKNFELLCVDRPHIDLRMAGPDANRPQGSLLAKVQAARAELSQRSSQRSFLNVQQQSKLQVIEPGKQQAKKGEEQTREGSGEQIGYHSSTSERFSKWELGSRGMSGSMCHEETEASFPRNRRNAPLEDRRVSSGATEGVRSRNPSSRDLLKAESVLEQRGVGCVAELQKVQESQNKQLQASSSSEAWMHQRSNSRVAGLQSELLDIWQLGDSRSSSLSKKQPS